MRNCIGAALAAALCATPAAFAVTNRCALELVMLEGRETPAGGGIQYFPATAVATSATTGTVSWTPQPDVISYNVVLAGGDAAYFATVGTTKGSSFSLAGLRPGTSYDGFVIGNRATNDFTFRSYTIYIDTPAATLPPVVLPPTIERFTVNLLGDGEVTFEFAARDATAIAIEQRVAGGNWANLADFFGLATEFTKSGVPDGVAIEFRLVARNEAGAVASAPVAVTTPPKAVVDLTKTGTNLAVQTDLSTLKLYDQKTGAEVGVIAPFGNDPVGSVVLLDVNGDGIEDVVAGSGPGVPSRVRVYDGKTARPLWSATPFEPTFLGGIDVAAGDVDGDGKPEVVVAAGPTGSPRVCVFDGVTSALEANFFAFDEKARGGASVTVGDFDGDGKLELLVGAGAGLAPEIKVFHWNAGTFVAMAPTLVFEPEFLGGVRVGVFDLDRNGTDEAIVAAGPTGAPRLRAFDLANPDIELLGVFVGDENARDGTFPLVVDGAPGPTLGALLPSVTFDPTARLLAASRVPITP